MSRKNLSYLKDFPKIKANNTYFKTSFVSGVVALNLRPHKVSAAMSPETPRKT
jgi:hypothetical protein